VAANAAAPCQPTLVTLAGPGWRSQVSPESAEVRIPVSEPAVAPPWLPNAIDSISVASAGSWERCQVDPASLLTHITPAQAAAAR